MKYTTDYKWKPLCEDMNGFGFRYRGIPYELDEFVSMNSVWSTGMQFEGCPITVHGYATDTYFSAVLIEVSNDGEMYRVCTVTT